MQVNLDTKEYRKMSFESLNRDTFIKIIVIFLQVYRVKSYSDHLHSTTPSIAILIPILFPSGPAKAGVSSISNTCTFCSTISKFPVNKQIVEAFSIKSFFIFFSALKSSFLLRKSLLYEILYLLFPRQESRFSILHFIFVPFGLTQIPSPYS